MADTARMKLPLPPGAKPGTRRPSDVKWQGQPGIGSAEPMARRCGVKLRRKLTYCMRFPLKGMVRCQQHRGTDPMVQAGSQNPNFRHGRYSIVVKGALGRLYEASLADPEILSLRDELALIDAQLIGLVENLSDDAAGARAWMEAKEMFGRMEQSIESGDGDGARARKAELARLLSAGAEQGEVWDEVYKAIEMHRRLVDSETKRQLVFGNFLSPNQAMTLSRALAAAVINNVHDWEVLEGIVCDMRQILAPIFTPTVVDIVRADMVKHLQTLPIGTKP